MMGAMARMQASAAVKVVLSSLTIKMILPLMPKSPISLKSTYGSLSKPEMGETAVLVALVS